jgi:hypothetical protein
MMAINPKRVKELKAEQQAKKRPAPRNRPHTVAKLVARIFEATTAAELVQLERMERAFNLRQGKLLAAYLQERPKHTVTENHRILMVSDPNPDAMKRLALAREGIKRAKTLDPATPIGKNFWQTIAKDLHTR